jgi:uncharacterized membrane protein
LRSAAASNTALGASLAWRALGVALFLAYPATAHYARPAAALALLAALAAYIVASFFIKHPLRWLVPPVGAGILLVAAPGADWLLYVPPVAINLALCWLFGRTLAHGRGPLIARFAMMEQGTLSPELASYTRTLTWLWTLLFAGAAAASLLLALSGNRDAWSLFTNLLNYLLVVALFLGEFAYRRLRFRSYQHQSPLQLLRNVRRTNLFER